MECVLGTEEWLAECYLVWVVVIWSAGKIADICKALETRKKKRLKKNIYFKYFSVPN